MSSATERRGILGPAWKSIANDCVWVLKSITNPQLRDQVAFAKTAARDLLDARIHGSQALSANLLDTVLRTHFDDGTASRSWAGRHVEAARVLSD